MASRERVRSGAALVNAVVITGMFFSSSPGG